MLARLNDALLRQRAPGFVTVALARLELHRARRARRAGRPPAIRCRSSRAAARATPLGEVGTPLGIIEQPELPEVTLELAPGDLLAFYTDGVTEAAAPRRLLDEADLAALVAERAAAGPAAGGRAPRAHRGRASPAATRATTSPASPCRCTPPPLVSERFPATPHAARDVAAALAPLADELGPRTAQDLRLLATELVANAVRHTGRRRRLGRGPAAARRATACTSACSTTGPGFELPERPWPRPRARAAGGSTSSTSCAVRWGTERGERHRVWLELEREDAA